MTVIIRNIHCKAYCIVSHILDINQREVDACKYLFNKKCFMRSRLREYEYEITQAGEVAMKAYFQDISRFWITTVLSIIALITGLFSISIQSEPLLKLLEQLLK